MQYQVALLAVLAAAPLSLADFEVYQGQYTDLEGGTGTNYQAWFLGGDPSCDDGEFIPRHIDLVASTAPRRGRD